MLLLYRVACGACERHNQENGTGYPDRLETQNELRVHVSHSIDPSDESLPNEAQNEEERNEEAQLDEAQLDDANLVTVAQRSNEVSAGVIVNILADAKIRAIAVGGFTAGFRAEAPGWVQVKVFQRDAERAREVIAEIKPAP